MDRQFGPSCATKFTLHTQTTWSEHDSSVASRRPATKPEIKFFIAGDRVGVK